MNALPSAFWNPALPTGIMALTGYSQSFSNAELAGNLQNRCYTSTIVHTCGSKKLNEPRSGFCVAAKRSTRKASGASCTSRAFPERPSAQHSATCHSPNCDRSLTYCTIACHPHVATQFTPIPPSEQVSRAHLKGGDSGFATLGL